MTKIKKCPPEGASWAQEIIGFCVRYFRVLDSVPLVALSTASSQQSTATEDAKNPSKDVRISNNTHERHYDMSSAQHGATRTQ